MSNPDQLHGTIAKGPLHAIHASPAVRDALLAYHDRSADDEAAAVVAAISAALFSPTVVAATAAERSKLERFLNAAAGEGYVLDGVDAADLYVALFPAEYEAALGALRGEPGPKDTPKEIF